MSRFTDVSKGPETSPPGAEPAGGGAREPLGAGPVIKVRDLVARFGADTILEGVSLDVMPGEVVVIAGGSGCGKSTLMNHIVGIYPPAGGHIEVAGEDVGSGDPAALARMRRHIGVAFQSGALFGSLTLLENVAMPISDHARLPRARAELLARLKLAMVGLAGYENHLPSEISGGMMKRAGLARAMALDPAVLFFDEPSAGLDPITAVELDMLINSINRSMGTTMVIVTHELASIFAIAHRVIMLDKEVKGIIAEGPPKDLAQHSGNDMVRSFFNREPLAERAGL